MPLDPEKYLDKAYKKLTKEEKEKGWVKGKEYHILDKNSPN